ncbi:MAG: TlpA disulfide reductase family protein [Myxococcota bacterium]
MSPAASCRLLIAVLGVACTPEPVPAAAPAKPVEATPETPPAPAITVLGQWRATLASPGGELPFEIVVEQNEGVAAAFAVNGKERVPFSSVKQDGRDLVLRVDHYDSEIRATVSEDEQRLDGRWTKTTPKGPSTMVFTAARGELPRFDDAIPKPDHPVPAQIDGDWAIAFAEKDGTMFAGRGIFRTEGGSARGTIMTDTGDYRYLDGRYEAGTLELSCFDGGHAFLFRARVAASGELAGDFWSRGSYHATWRAKPIGEGVEDPLADPYGVVALSDSAKDGRFEFSFPDLDGKIVSDGDARFEGKVVLVDIFGTWCPNCNDYAPVLADWHQRYGGRGLEIVGLAFEMTGDVVRDKEFVGKYARKYGLEFPVLLAGTSDKTDAAALLPTLTKIASYPTTVFIGRDGRVHKIHSGFAGPATGAHHTKLLAEMESEIEALLGPAQ